jgi:hypothetical protein
MREPRPPHVPTAALAALLGAWIAITMLGHEAPAGVPALVTWAALAGGLVAAAAVLPRGSTAPIALDLLVCEVIAAMLVTDLVLVGATPFQNDLGLGLTAGQRFLDGVPVYPAAVTLPAGPAEYPYVYPPPTLPLFAVLALLPRPAVEVAWLGALAVALLAAARVARLQGPVHPATLLLWPAAFSALWVGNVAILLFLLYAIGRRHPSAMVPAGAVKVGQSVGVLWLVRDRRWRSLAAGVALVAAIAAVTLPLVGLDRWVEWLRGLDVYRQQAERFGGHLAGEGLPAFVPIPVWLLLAAVVVALALCPGGAESHTRVGVAAVVASPTLHSHGFLTALPAFAALPGPWFWVALGLTSTPAFPAWWLAVVVVVASWLRREPVVAVRPSPVPHAPTPPLSVTTPREPNDA